MIRFEKRANVHPNVAWVADVAGHPDYRGAGWVALTPDGFRYLDVDTDDGLDAIHHQIEAERLAEGFAACASCHELVVVRGSATAAALNVTGGLVPR